MQSALLPSALFQGEMLRVVARSRGSLIFIAGFRTISQTTAYLSSLLLTDIWVVSSLRLNATVTIWVCVICEHLCMVPLDIHVQHHTVSGRTHPGFQGVGSQGVGPYTPRVIGHRAVRTPVPRASGRMHPRVPGHQVPGRRAVRTPGPRALGCVALMQQVEQRSSLFWSLGKLTHKGSISASVIWKRSSDQLSFHRPYTFSVIFSGCL